MTKGIAAALLVALAARGGPPVPAAQTAASQGAFDEARFIPVGALHAFPADAATRRRDLEEMRRLRFTVVATRDAGATDRPLDLHVLGRLLAGSAQTPIATPIAPQRVPIGPATRGYAALTIAAWTAIARGSRGVIFDDWRALSADRDSLAAAAEFADALTRNAALYAPLRPRQSDADVRAVRVVGDAERFETRFLESRDALVLIALNHADTRCQVAITFGPDIPEAIWQNMLTGGAVNFVASADGPTYERTFPPKDVLVLMIRKGLR